MWIVILVTTHVCNVYAGGTWCMYIVIFAVHSGRISCIRCTYCRMSVGTSICKLSGFHSVGRILAWASHTLFNNLRPCSRRYSILWFGGRYCNSRRTLLTASATRMLSCVSWTILSGSEAIAPPALATPSAEKQCNRNRLLILGPGQQRKRLQHRIKKTTFHCDSLSHSLRSTVSQFRSITIAPYLTLTLTPYTHYILHFGGQDVHVTGERLKK